MAQIARTLFPGRESGGGSGFRPAMGQGRSLKPAPTGQLWLCAHFPDIPLEVLKLDRTQPTSTVEDRKGRPCLHAVSEAARQTGVETGMTVAAAYALCPGLSIRPRDSMAEKKALNRLAEAGLEFTPWVSLDQPQSLLLEIRASLRLFGGAESLREKLRQRLLEQGYRAVIAVTPSSEASGLLARLGVEAVVEEREALRSVLGGAPVAALPLDDMTLRRLVKTGIRQLADLWRLPRDGLTRRYGADFLRRLDALAGSQAEVLRAFHRPPCFIARRDLPMELERLDHFFPAIEQMAAEFLAYLKARDAAAWGVRLDLLHSGRPATRIELGFRSAHRDAAHWLKLLREKLERVALPAPVVAVQWASGAIVPFEAERTDLFGDGSSERDWQAVLEELQARLGHKALRRFAVRDDHRPERAMGGNEFIRKDENPEANEFAPIPLPPRPLWLFAESQVLAVQNIRFLSEPERIESGWWDGAPVRRDYCLALDRRGRKLWVFQDLRDSGGWYLHGLFG